MGVHLPQNTCLIEKNIYTVNDYLCIFYKDINLSKYVELKA